MTYSWEILDLFTRDVTNSDGIVLTDAVCQVVWRKVLTAEDGINKSFYLSATTVNAVETSESDFVSYGSLSPDIVVDWIESSLTDADTAMINKILEKNHATKPEQKSLPWL
tara:strand:+ start:12194 stop:12526 length:333 start_codon:yes stop_codon:yes gene_type:complete